MSNFTVRAVAGQVVERQPSVKLDSVVVPGQGVIGYDLELDDRVVEIRARSASGVSVVLRYLGHEVGRALFTNTVPSLIVPFVLGHLNDRVSA